MPVNIICATPAVSVVQRTGSDRISKSEGKRMDKKTQVYRDSLAMTWKKHFCEMHGDSNRVMNDREYRKREVTPGSLVCDSIVFTKREIRFIKSEVELVNGETRERFDNLLGKCGMAWLKSFSRNTNTVRNQPEYSQMKAMGKEIIPLVLEKMLIEENFFIINLYEDLQDDITAKIIYKEYDPQMREGMHQKVKRTIKLWLSKNM